jgi:competence protein ComEA
MAANTPSTVSSLTVVHVAGAVVAPGVYSLAGSPRVTDAVAAAGGMSVEADPNAVNLAAPVHDGERVYIPKVGEVTAVAVNNAGGPAIAAGPVGPVNLNTATAEELDVLPGVGPATAAAIVAHRQQHGPFQTVDQLGDVRGIGPAKLDALRGLVTV